MYTIKPDNLLTFDVFCDQTTEGGGWTVFQKRLDGSVDFYRNWTDYKHGFGDLSGEFWLGMDKIYRLTPCHNSKLRVDLEDFEGNTAYAEYNTFGVMSENDKYKLTLGSYSGKTVSFCLILLLKHRSNFVQFQKWWGKWGMNGQFWLGLDKIHRLTSCENNMLRVDLADFK